MGLLAQLVEQRTLNPLVECSNHSGPTKNSSIWFHIRLILRIYSGGLLAQLVEQRTLNPLVECSNHSGPTKYSKAKVLTSFGFFVWHFGPLTSTPTGPSKREFCHGCSGYLRHHAGISAAKPAHNRASLQDSLCKIISPPSGADRAGLWPCCLPSSACSARSR